MAGWVADNNANIVLRYISYKFVHLIESGRFGRCIAESDCQCPDHVDWFPGSLNSTVSSTHHRICHSLVMIRSACLLAARRTSPPSSCLSGPQDRATCGSRSSKAGNFASHFIFKCRRASSLSPRPLEFIGFLSVRRFCDVTMAQPNCHLSVPAAMSGPKKNRQFVRLPGQT